MGSLTTPKYERMDCEANQGKTQTGVVEHNEETAVETGEPHSFRRQTERPEATEPADDMANNLLTQSDSESQAAAATAGGVELDLTFGIPIKERPIWVDLYESIRDVFFPPHYPPLELTSTPIPVPDRMAVKRNPWAWGIATSINVAILLVLLFFLGKKIIETVKPTSMSTIDLTDFKGLQAANKAGGGGGGGDHSIIDPTKGKLPKLEKNPVVPPQVQTVDKPIIPMEAAINVQKELTLPDNPMLPNIGMKNSVNVQLASNGQGSGSGMGTGSGGGLGSGNGNGYGPGEGGNAGGGLYRVGGGVSVPVVLNDVQAEFSDEARRDKYQGVCIVSIIVDTQGNPQNPRVVRPLGMGLDEKALEAVRKYKFKPAMKDGKTPVPVMVNIEINFRLY
jgi:TonB family protein